MNEPCPPTLSPPRRGREAWTVIGVSALAFLLFYCNAYFSSGFRGMLGYEVKDTLIHLQSYFRAAERGGTYLWDPYYLSYTPIFPQAPLHSPVTRLFLLLGRAGAFPTVRSLFVFYLALAAVLQVLCAYTMYLFLRSCRFDLLPSLLGGLGYAYNQQTFVFGIRHGYERISALLLIPLVLRSFFRLWEPLSPRRYRGCVALTALLLGLTLVCNADVKPTAFFMIFLAIAAVLNRPFRPRNIAALLVIVVLAGAVYAVQGLPTVYTFRDSVRGQESLETLLEFSLRPAKLLLTHVSTAFTDRPDYPWESTAEYSLSFLLLALLGLPGLRRHPQGRTVLAALVVSLVWILGVHTPLRPVLGWIMRVSGMHHPARMAVLLYFCYSFSLAQAAQRLPAGRSERSAAVVLGAIPLALLGARLAGVREIPIRFVILGTASWLVILLVSLRSVSKSWLWLVAACFILERATPFVPLEESRVTDPTKYYGFGEIYRRHPRVEAILADPVHREHRAFFGGKDLPDLFSHPFYLNAFSDGVRPIFAYFWNEEWPQRVRDLQWTLLRDWGNPMWDLLNVKYFVDLESLFSAWDESEVSRNGIEHLRPIDRYLRVNPGAEGDLFLRYRTARLLSDEEFLSGLREGTLDLPAVAYLNDVPAGRPLLAGDPETTEGTVRLIRNRGDEFTAEVSVPAPALLVLSEFWYFPWRVEVDGSPAELLRVDNVLMGVELAPGGHRVRFFFHSRHWKFVLPALLSYGLALVLAVYSFAALRPSRRSGVEGARP